MCAPFTSAAPAKTNHFRRQQIQTNAEQPSSNNQRNNQWPKTSTSGRPHRNNQTESPLLPRQKPDSKNQHVERHNDQLQRFRISQTHKYPDS
jgi:hypothetical protein